MALDEPMTGMYRAVITIAHPIMRPWSRLRVTGLEHLPTSGPTLLVANHDSYWDPIAIGVAARARRRCARCRSPRSGGTDRSLR